MDETPSFNCDNLRILVLDEADRILDMGKLNISSFMYGDTIAIGFQDAVNSIIEFLPQNRQTLLFSATQTRSIKDLARLSLKVHLALISIICLTVL